MKKITKLLSLALSLSLMLTACSSSKPQDAQNTQSSQDTAQQQDTPSLDDEVLKPGTLVVGISADYPPFESLDNSGNLVGYDVDMAKYLAEHLQTKDGQAYTVDFVQMDFSTIISALQTGQVDVGIAAFSYDPDRQCLFTDPYYNSAQVICVNKSSDIKTKDDLNGKTVAAGEGTTGYEAVSEIEGVTVTSPGDYLQDFELLRVNQIDAVVCDKVVGTGYAENSEDFVVLDEPLTEENLCVTVKKGNENLLDALNKAIEEFNSSGKSDEYKTNWGL